MGTATLTKDPYNLIITGVGGQGNVLASRVLGNLLSDKGFSITIGETFGASQRGGSVMSHMRISAGESWSPQIPKGQADMVVALEPIEALRVLHTYGHPGVKVISNTRSIYPVGVISGDSKYPSMDELQKTIEGLTEQAWFINATDAAMELGNPIFGNIMMVGALAKTGVLPIDRDGFEKVMLRTMGEKKTPVNLKAFDMGAEMIN
ncbi:indolepyruvate ferredoxin oxidoreductase beta subunit [Desulfatibacillum alkenivorans DSM 16219]|jgi:indolepyruvate ferredoxin oxidoreductase beta subunit|uniref:Indolepyruvate ferredoxin oxidoreductase beta subunit n=1 Tax=Desulfatibacillum alkenivorans DSM 16219 TaxID=1121393 RepID=A0A1M6ZEL1_9BACT|nr:indolepyruvate oxidoreductase subunit beta [Desulfatibacillum alkenivorans]SHL28932.1 indolepyruvate ferredoxin oxidoreductase beta subunit [Desulfatibacillum alkenivorans DSM 16219]